MHRVFYLGNYQYQMVRWSNQIGESDPLVFESLPVALDFVRCLMGDPYETGKLQSLAVELGYGSALSAEGNPRFVEQLARDIVQRRVLVLRDARVFYAAVGSQEEKPKTEKPKDPPPATTKRAVKKDWIEIILLDMEDEPVPNERWEVTWPDGATVSKGKTDRRGIGRVDLIEPSGLCKITFPDRDLEAWEKI